MLSDNSRKTFFDLISLFSIFLILRTKTDVWRAFLIIKHVSVSLPRVEITTMWISLQLSTDPRVGRPVIPREAFGIRSTISPRTTAIYSKGSNWMPFATMTKCKAPKKAIP